jgi:uncharacterized membrane protein
LEAKGYQGRSPWLVTGALARRRSGGAHGGGDDDAAAFSGPISRASFWTFWPDIRQLCGISFMYPRARFEALTDGIFAVAMTLLVLDLRLPENFHPHNAEELLRGLYDLVPNFIPYVLSFLVLGLRWASSVQVRTKTEGFSRSYFKWWLAYLLLITCVPFTTTVVGRFAGLAPAIWLYAGNIMLIGVVSFALLHHTPHIERDELLRDRQISLAFLIGTSLLAIAWSFVNPREALFVLALNLIAPLASRWGKPTITADPPEPGHRHPS